MLITSSSYLFWKYSFFLFHINRTGYFRTWWTLVLPVINVDAYLFWLSHTFSVTLRIQEYVFSVYDVLHNSKETEFWRHLSVSQYKYRGIFSVMSRMEICPSSYLQWYGFVKLGEFSVKVTTLTFTVSVSNTHILSLLFYLIVFHLNKKAILLKVCKLDNFESHNTLQVSFIDIRT